MNEILLKEGKTMFSISDLVKKEFDWINQAMGKGNIGQAVRTAKEARDIVISHSSPVQAEKKISGIEFIKKCSPDKSSPDYIFQVIITMTKNPFNTDQCSSKEEYIFQWDESEAIWKLESLIETD
jgi:hypothetical protein